ncbi:hypothetical protein [Flavobacterium tructae]|uniref:Phage tail tape measure protein n=1 Tax=Flavobacterium tructae TaxID=1114873 RepID=A0A1S1J1H7_9FLAO|nr:hypothetical protein [Flavobacterium tructae]OHT44422.1 hypothetical protein BHE19_11925 [Flavobacterium tructae]OXB19442.1 hypothetical protein B0A71_12950 [Flavobacterium tructae]
MANSKGIITRKEIIEEEALTWGKDYANQTQIAIDKNKEFVQGILQIAGIQKQIKEASSNSTYNAALQQGILATQKAILAIKEREAAEISANKIRMSTIALEDKERKAKESSNKATLEEKILLAETNKQLKQAARERLGLVGAYAKLNQARLDAQKRLAELISAEKKNTAEIIVAQAEFDKLDARVKAVDAAIRNYTKNIGNYGSAFEGLRGTLKDLIATFGLVTGLELFGVVVKDIFSIVLDFDKQLIAVGKTTNMTGEELKQFGRELVELGDKSNGITVAGLIESAEVAGQLGVTGTANILKFSSAIEKLKLTSDINSEEGVAQFAKFIEVSSDSFENADRLASVITQLGNSFSTTEKEVLSNSTEIQKGVAVYNTSAQGVLALGAATSSLGSEAEVSASSIQKTFGVINQSIATGKNLEAILKLTNLTQKELSKQFNQDATGVFVKFVKGLNTAKKEGQNLAIVLGELGLDEVRSFKTIGSLAANYDLLASAMAQAKKEYEENVALNKEVEAASESLSSILADINDRWEAYVLMANDASSGSIYLAKVLKFVRDNFKEIMDFIVKFGTVLITYVGILRTVNFVMVTYSALQAAATAAQIRFALATGIGTRSILAQAAAARQAMVAQEGLNVATKATPWGLILAFLSAAIVAYMVFNDEMSDAEKNIKKIVDANKELEESEKAFSDARDQSNNERFKDIEQDIKLRKAQGENSDKLDKEEIAMKKKILVASLEVFTELKKAEADRTQTEINSSRQRIAQFQIEKNYLANGNWRVSKEGHNSDELDDLIKTEKDKISFKKATAIKNAQLTTDEKKRLEKQLADLDKDAAIKDAEFKKEMSKKELAALRKKLKDAFELWKKGLDDQFKLQQFRLQVGLDMDDEILENDKMSYDKRLDSLSDYNQLASERIRNAAEYELFQLGKYNEKTGKFIRELSDLEISELLETGKIKKELTNGQKLILEKFQDDQKKITLKGVKDRQKIIDSEVEEVKKRIDADLLTNDTKLNKALEAENILYNASLNKNTNLEKAQEEHERRIIEIKRSAAKEAIAIQIKAIEDILAAQDKLPENERISVQKRKQYDNELSRLKLENSELNVLNNDQATKKILFFNEEYFKKVEELSQNLTFALQDLGNAIFERRIQNIEADQQANDAYYAKQIELAKNDERQKDLLQKERDKKNDALEKKKRKEQEKQAIFNKAMAIAEASMNTGKAVTAALTAGPGIGLALAVITAAVAAVQLAAIVATPLPKYKDGRKGGKKEIAVINDGIGPSGGYVQEVIERKSGAIEVPTGSNKIVQLYEGDTVHKSVGDFNKMQRAAMMASLNMQGQKMSDFQATQYYETAYGKEMLEEMKLTRKVIENQKQPIIKIPKIDIPHEVWKSKNTNWS